MYYYQAAADCLDNEEYFPALDYVKRAIAADSMMLDNYFLLADIYSDMGLYTLSNNVYYMLMAADEELTDCYFRIAQNFIYMGDTDTAIWYLKRSIALGFDEDDLFEAADFLNIINGDIRSEGLKLITPEHGHYRTLEGSRQALAEGNFEDAVGMLKGIPKESEHYTEALNNMAFGYACLNRHDLSLGASQEALKNEPDNVYTLCNLISSYSGLKDGEGLRSACRALDKIKAQEPADNFKIAVAYLECGDITAAVRHLNVYLSSYPYNEAALLLLGLAYHNQGDIMQAKRCMVDLIKIDSTNTIAKYYNGLMSPPDYHPQKLEYIRQVPATEMLERLKRLSGFAELKAAIAAQAVNDNTGDILGLIKWCFLLPNFDLHERLIKKIVDCRTAAADGFLQKCLADSDMPQFIKRQIIPLMLKNTVAKNVSVVVDDKFRTLNYRVTKAVWDTPASFYAAYREVFAALAMIAEGFEEDLLKSTRRLVAKLKERIQSMHSVPALSALIAYEFGGYRPPGVKVAVKDLIINGEREEFRGLDDMPFGYNIEQIKLFRDIPTVCGLFGASQPTLKAYIKKLNDK